MQTYRCKKRRQLVWQFAENSFQARSFAVLINTAMIMEYIGLRKVLERMRYKMIQKCNRLCKEGFCRRIFYNTLALVGIVTGYGLDDQGEREFESR
jgi:hypothetical protein